MCSKDIEFVTVSDGLPDDHPRLGDLSAMFNATLEMGPALDELFANLLKKSAITCVIRDSLFCAVHPPAKRLNVPIAVFVTASAVAEHCKFHLSTFISAGILPLPPPPDVNVSAFKTSGTLALPQSDAEAAARTALLTCLPGGSPTMRVDDIPTFFLTHDLENFFIRHYLNTHNPPLPESDCILLNTFSDLEGDVLNAMTGTMNENVLALGPLVLQSMDGVEEVKVAEVGSGLWKEDSVSLTWLDDQKPRSVLFLSFGSLISVSKEQLREYALGLEASNVPFLWAIRPELTADATEEFQTMFTAFVERTRDRALLVPWVPQTAVLSHPSVGAFLTHCGWNSVLESICCGVPMLGWPRFSDQKTNIHYITNVWKIGLELEQGLVAEIGIPIVRKEEVTAKVRKIMGTVDGDVANMRSRCASLQMAAKRAVGHGGSSQVALAKFVELIISRSKDRSQTRL